MNELTDEVSMLEKVVLENDSFDLDTKLTYKDPDYTKIKFNTHVKQKL